jgi:hypothetical protein
LAKKLRALARLTLAAEDAVAVAVEVAVVRQEVVWVDAALLAAEAGSAGA